MSKRQYVTLLAVFIAIGAAVAVVDLLSPAGIGGPILEGISLSAHLGLFVAVGFAVGAVIGVVLSLPAVLVFHYATPETRGVVRFLVILASGLVVASWLYWGIVPAFERAF
jgi:hypothetical protein